MTATVVSLESRRKQRAQAARKCRACRPETGFTCYPHQLARLADRVREAQGSHADALFVDPDEFAAVVGDVLAVIDRVTTTYLDNDERSAR